MQATTIIETQCGPVECASYGEGPAIIALHGGMGGQDQSQLLAQSAITKPGFRILALSRPGYLGTPLRSGRSPEEQADIYAALLDTLGIARVGVIAVSAGGLSALQFALRHPTRCWGMVTVSACTGHLDPPPNVFRGLAMLNFMARIPFMTAMMQRKALADPEAASRRSIADTDVCKRTLADPDAGPLMIALQTSIFDRLSRRIPGTINDIAYEQQAVAYPLENIATPVLAIHGTADRIVPFAHGLAIANGVPHAQFMAVEGGEHVSLFTHLGAIRARVGSFLVEQKK